MAKNRIKAQQSKKAQTESPGWSNRIVPFLDKHAVLITICLVTIAAARIVSTYSRTGLTFDEPAHIACGMEFVAKHTYTIESQHPPLSRVMTALGPYLEGARPLKQADARTMYVEGVSEIYHDGRPQRVTNLMRTGILPFFVLACAIVFLWAQQLFDRTIAVIATALFTLLPPVLAHAGLGTTDMALTACLSAAFISLLMWAEKPNWVNTVLLGTATAAAVLSKFTALVYLPSAAACALVFYIAAQRPGLARLMKSARSRLPRFAVAVLVGAVLIWAGYLFSFGKIPDTNIRVPAPELFAGIRIVLEHNAAGHPAFLLGEFSREGWWYYFPVVLAVKTPIAFLVLLVVGTLICWRRRALYTYVLPVAFALGILAPAMVGRINIGVRHILPVYVGFSIIAALAARQLLQRAATAKWAGIAVAGLFVWLAVSGATQHPSYLAYFNELVSEPENVLTDSDLDWGQDTIRLAEVLRARNIAEVSFVTMNLSPERLQQYPGLPKVHPINPLSPRAGWTVVSPTLWKVTEYGLYHKNPGVEPWFAKLRPAERVGSLLMYYVPPQGVRNSAPPGNSYASTGGQ